MGKRRINAIKAHPNASLVGVTDENLDLAKEIAGESDCEVIESPLAAATHPDIDCVVVSVPNHLHREIALAGLRSGKHVFCEKPLAGKPEEAADMVRAAKEAGKILKVGSNLRYFPNVLKARQLLDEQAIGEPMFMRSYIGHGGWNLQQPGTWFADEGAVGGGTFLDNGCHVFDIGRWFLGEVVACTGVVKTNLWPIGKLEDNGFGIFETADDKVISVQASWTEWNGYAYIEVYGKEGYIRIDSRGRNCITALGDQYGKEQIFDLSELPPTSFDDEFSDFLTTLAAGGVPTPTGYDGLRAVQMAWGVYESSRTGRKVDLPPSPELDPTIK